MKKLTLALSGLVLVSALIISIGLTGCSSGPAVPASHFTDDAVKTNYQNCLDCHKTGVNGATLMPEGHSKYTNNDKCLNCHKSAP